MDGPPLGPLRPSHSVATLTTLLTIGSNRDTLGVRDQLGDHTGWCSLACMTVGGIMCACASVCPLTGKTIVIREFFKFFVLYELIQWIHGMHLILTKILLHKNYVNEINTNYCNTLHIGKDYSDRNIMYQHSSLTLYPTHSYMHAQWSITGTISGIAASAH